MNDQEYRNFLSEYLQDQKSKLSLLEQYILPSFNSFQFSVRDISEENYRKWTNELSLRGIDNKCSVLYYFQIKSGYNRDEICSIISRMKMKPGKSERALPRVNENNFKTEYNILYVGKTNTNFPNRFKQHLGLGTYSTFALHLIHWATEMNLVLELYFTECKMEADKLYLLEHIENVLHHSLKPILGRQGR